MATRSEKRGSLILLLAVGILIIIAIALTFIFFSLNRSGMPGVSSPVNVTFSNPSFNYSLNGISFDLYYKGLSVNNSTAYNGTLYNIRFACADSSFKGSPFTSNIPYYSVPYAQTGQTIGVPSLTCYNSSGISMNLLNGSHNLTIWMGYELYRLGGPTRSSIISTIKTK